MMPHLQIRIPGVPQDQVQDLVHEFYARCRYQPHWQAVCACGAIVAMRLEGGTHTSDLRCLNCGAREQEITWKKVTP